MINNVILVGRITDTPKLITTKTGTSVSNFSLAVEEIISKDNKKVVYPQVVAFGASAENLCKYITKGKLLSVEGKLNTRSYDDKDGKKVYVTEVWASNIKYLEPKDKQESNNSQESVETVSEDTSNPFLQDASQYL